MCVYLKLDYDFNTKHKFHVVGSYLTQSHYPGIYFTQEAQESLVVLEVHLYGVTIIYLNKQQSQMLFHK